LSTRLASVVPVLLAVLAVGCATSAPAPPSAPSGGASSPGTAAPATQAPRGDVEGVQAGAPELVVESAGADALRVTAIDTGAKAWRISVADRAGDDRLEIVVETTDIVPGIRVDEIVDGKVVASDDLTRMPGDPTVAAGGCHRTLDVCYSSADIGVREGVGFVAILTFRDTQRDFSIVASSASWPEEPFILGPWRDSQPFQSWSR
jgi:hypothetical protein